MACDFPDLPKGYEYNFMYETREVRIKEVSTAEKVQEWINQLQSITGVVWKVETTFPRSGRVNIFRKHFRCHHNTRRKTDSRYKSKNTNCPAKMRVVVKRDYSEYPKSQLAKADPNAKEWPCIIEFKGEHNHSLTSEQVLRYHPLTQNAREKIVELYKKGHTPASAYKAFNTQVMCQLGPEYTSFRADRSVLPTKIDFQNIWVNDFKKRYGLNLSIKLNKKKTENEDNPNDPNKYSSEHENSVGAQNCRLDIPEVPFGNLLHSIPSQNVSTSSSSSQQYSTQQIRVENVIRLNELPQTVSQHFKLIECENNVLNNASLRPNHETYKNHHEHVLPQLTNVSEDNDESILCKLLLTNKETEEPQRRAYNDDNFAEMEVIDYDLANVIREEETRNKHSSHQDGTTLTELRSNRTNASHNQNNEIIKYSLNCPSVSRPSDIHSQLNNMNNFSLNVDGVLKEFDELCSEIKKSAESDPINVIPAIRKLMNNFNTHVNSHSDLLSGLEGAFKPAVKRKRPLQKQQ